MENSFSVFGLKTGIIRKGDNIAEIIVKCASDNPEIGGIADGDIIVSAESAAATAEGSIVELSKVVPSDKAREYAAKYKMDPALAEVVLQECDGVAGGIPGFILALKQGTLLPNAGIDASNAPPGCVTTLPKNPDKTAEKIFHEIKKLTGKRTGVLVIDSRTHAMRLGCSGVAIGCYGITAVTDERGKKDIFGHELEVTRRAVGDDIASAAELVMGESDERTPFALIRGLSKYLADGACGIESIDPSECLFMGAAMNADPSFFNRK